MGTKSLPPGFRFHPTDEELVGYYLKRKVNGQEIELEVIPAIDLYKFDPWELPDRSFLPKRDKEWFFFCPRDNKYPNGSRTNRATRSGYWKATGKDRKVACQSVITALRKTLVFYRGRAPAGDRTDWVMHEYRLCEEISQGITNFVGAFALCHIMKRNEHGQKGGDAHGESRRCRGDETSAAEDSPPNSSTSSFRNNGSVTVCPPNSALDNECQYDSISLPNVVSKKFQDFPPLQGSDGSPFMLQNQFQASPMGFPYYTPMDFSLTSPSMDICEEASFMLACPSPMAYMDMCSNARNPSFQNIQWEEPRNVYQPMNGLESWNLMFSSPVCRQASGDGVGEPTSLWSPDETAIAR